MREERTDISAESPPQAKHRLREWRRAGLKELCVDPERRDLDQEPRGETRGAGHDRVRARHDADADPRRAYR
jgi:hypothetical protein